MRIVFMGTPDFAVKSLERLYNDGHDIAGVFTKEDKPRNRGMKLSFSPVKELAVSRGTPVYQPHDLKNESTDTIINNLQCDIIAVVAYGKILTKEIIDAPPLGCINIHGSLLPKYRGASPVQHAILNGDKETGVTSQYVAEKIDSGDIIFNKKTLIGDDETSEELFIRLSILGAQLLSETVDAISGGFVEPIPQDNANATYAPRLTKNMSPIDWKKSAYSIKCKVRGLLPWPAATMELGGNILKVCSVDVIAKMSGMQPGSIIMYGKQGIEVACGDFTVLVKEVQAAGSKRMHVYEYLKGNPINCDFNQL